MSLFSVFTLKNVSATHNLTKTHIHVFQMEGQLLICGSYQSEWLPTPIFLPGEFHGQKSLADCSLWGHKELDMTERLTLL